MVFWNLEILHFRKAFIGIITCKNVNNFYGKTPIHKSKEDLNCLYIALEKMPKEVCKSSVYKGMKIFKLPL